MEKREATCFGKELRKLRVDREETQADMARRLGVSQALLSLIERGERAVPPGMAAGVIEEYGLGGEEAARLEAAQARSAVRLVVRLEDATACQREAAALFARRFGELTDAQPSSASRRDKLVGSLGEAVKEALQE